MSDTEDEQKLDQEIEDFNKEIDESVNQIIDDETENTSSDEGGEEEENSGENEDSEDNSDNTNSDNENDDGDNENDNDRPMGEAGISNAYGEEVSDFDNGKKKKSAGSTNQSVDYPSRDRKPIKAGDQKDIMEMFWKDIVGFYEKGLNFVVDGTLDFATWVLFAELKEGKETPKEEKDEKDPFIIAKGIYEGRMAKPIHNNEFICKAHKEILDNIDLEKAGASAKWDIWGKEPPVFQKLKELEEKAQADPNSEEAKKWNKFVEVPEVMNGYLFKERFLSKSSTMIAALQEFAGTADDKIPENISKGFKNIKEALKDSEISGDDLKETIGRNVDALLSEINPQSEVYKGVIQKLKNIKEITSGNTNDVAELKKNIKEKYKEGKDLLEKVPENPSFMKERIEATSQEYYQRISENIDKIYEANINTPEKLPEIMNSYIRGITKGIKEAQGACKSAQKYHIKLPAKGKVEAIDNAINNFQLDGNTIQARPKAAKEDQSPLKGDDVAMFNVLNSYGR